MFGRLGRYRREVRPILGVLAVVGLLVGGYWLVVQHLPFLLRPSEVRGYVRGFGGLAPLAYVAIQILQVVVSPIPGHAMGIFSGYLFGAALGTIYSVIGTTIGTFLAIWISRKLGRPFVEKVVSEENLGRFDRISGTSGETAFFLVFLIPGLPDDVVCFLAGLTDIKVRRLVVLAVIGRLPGLFVSNLAGAGIAQRRYTEATLLLFALFGIGVIVYLNRDRMSVVFGTSLPV